jgi:hypothetical protein
MKYEVRKTRLLYANHYFLLQTWYFVLRTSYLLLPTSYFLLPTSALKDGAMGYGK